MMLEILKSRDPFTVVISFEGKATKEDAMRMDEHVKVHFKENEMFNVLAFIKEIDGTNIPGLINGLKVDMKRWNQFNKFAIISDQDLVGNLASLANYLPGLRVKYFKEDQVEEAWEWILEPSEVD